MQCKLNGCKLPEKLKSVIDGQIQVFIKNLAGDTELYKTVPVMHPNQIRDEV